MTPNQNHAEQGLHHLRLAVMDVLAGGQCLGPSEYGVGPGSMKAWAMALGGASS